MRELIALVLTLTPLVAVAAPIVPSDEPAAVALALRDAGYRAKLDRDADGFPRIESAAGGTIFYLDFYGCKADGGDCAGFLLGAGFDLDGGIGRAEIETWNREMVVGRAYRDSECDPVIDHYVVADPEGSEEAFLAVIGTWTEFLDAFREHIGFDDEAMRAVVTDCGGDIAL